MYKLPNFGSTVRAIDTVLPHLLHKTMPEHLVHKNITFNLLPEQHNLSFHGSRVYHTIQVLLQVAITPWLLPTGTQLSILSRRTTEDKEISDRKYIVNWRSVLPEGTPTNDDPCDQHSNPATPGHLGHLGSLGHLGPQKFQQFQESTPTFLSNTEMTRKTGLQMDLDLPTAKLNLRNQAELRQKQILMNYYTEHELHHNVLPKYLNPKQFNEAVDKNRIKNHELYSDFYPLDGEEGAYIKV